MSLQLQPVRVATGSEDEEGQLVFVNDSLVALLVRLSDLHGEDVGKWVVEASFGVLVPCEPHGQLFKSLEEAQAWLMAPQGRMG